MFLEIQEIFVRQLNYNVAELSVSAALCLTFLKPLRRDTTNKQPISRCGHEVGCKRLVYARYGRELLGFNSPVSVSM